jgi:YVTN family beta-propeller protein
MAQSVVAFSPLRSTERAPRKSRTSRRPLGPNVNAIVVSEGSDAIAFVNLAFDRVEHTLSVGRSPSRIVLDATATHAYVSNFEASSISIVDVANAKVLGAIATGNGPAAMAIDGSGRYLFACNVLDGTVISIDLTTNASISTAIVGKHPNSIAIEPGGKTGYVANSGDRTLSLLTIAPTGHLSAKPLLLEEGADAVFLSPVQRTAYLPGDAGSVFIFDRTSEKMTGRIDGFAGPRAIDFDPGGTRAYVTETASNTIAVVDLQGKAIVSRIGVGTQPYAIVSDRAKRHLFTADFAGSAISVVDLMRGTSSLVSGFNKPRDLVVIG